MVQGSMFVRQFREGREEWLRGISAWGGGGDLLLRQLRPERHMYQL